MTVAALGHRVRCITTRTGVVNVCPDCGYINITDWTWDFARDPEREVIDLDDQEVLFDFVEALQDLGSSTALPCLPSCEEAAEDRELRALGLDS